MQNIEESIVSLKIAELVEVIVRKKQMSAKDALCYLYNSEFYLKNYMILKQSGGIFLLKNYILN